MSKKSCFLLFLSIFSLSSFAQTLDPQVLKSIKIRNIGPAAMSGRITAIAVDPFDDDIIYAGAASGGVWQSRSGGTQWTPIFDEAPTQSIGSIAINPQNSAEIWVGTGEGNPRNSQNFGAGIFKSTDGGQTWQLMGLENTKAIHRILVHPQNPQIVWAAVIGSAYGPNSERGVYKTTDGGLNWRRVLFVNDLTGCADLVIDPSNPNKLIAAMWEYRRWPWFFKSGGKGSGLFVSTNGGESWTQRTASDGLPEGELGRIGLAIAASKPNICYALVEAKDNALYKSTDGGKKWHKMTEKGMGDRPFYYAEIYVDPKNENRIYSIHTIITKSEDGGRSFDSWAGWVIHPDHHAFWINPNDPDHIIDGNDGGLNITRDGGQTWHYADNIPVGQFYHINVDNELPYNIYGGLQDNGSWVGPSAVWRDGGLRNQYWQEVLFGDGFDAMPQKDDSRYCFAMSQGGELHYIDRETGHNRYVKPLHPDDEKLRFNWNAALAQDPHRATGLYFGSQFLHYSPDLGITWQLLSPDLTTNDTSKMHQDISGGLTFDATNAENHCTILAIAPSASDKNTIWIGTDDGCVQLTQDGGKSWQRLDGRMPDFPRGAWVPQILVSPKNPGEAWVVVNNYRQNDWDAYLYHTTDFGRRWKRKASPKVVGAFCLSVFQDTETPNLVFLGTDHGLYLSFDTGETWTKWPAPQFPSVPVNDMVLQPRDGDLVLGTFGRAIWILDNLSALRELARSELKLVEQPFKIFQPQEAVLAAWASYSGPRFSASETYRGENRGTAVRIPLWVKPTILEKKQEESDKKEKQKSKEDGKNKKTKSAAKEKALVTIFSEQGDTLRRFKTVIDTGFTIISWGLDTKGVHFPSNREQEEEALEPGRGPSVVPGKYKVLVAWGDYRDSTTVIVLEDPRLKISIQDRNARASAMREVYKTVENAEKNYRRLVDMEKTMKLVDDLFESSPDSIKQQLKKLSAPLRDSISSLKERFFTHKEVKGIQRNPNNLNAQLRRALAYIGGSDGAPTENAQIAIRKATKQTEFVVAQISLLLEGSWKTYQQWVEQQKISVFK